MRNYQVPPQDCLVILEFSQPASLREISRRLGIDPSALLRKVQRIATTYEALEKVNGRWRVTEKGHRLNRWTEETILSQQQILNETNLP